MPTVGFGQPELNRITVTTDTPNALHFFSGLTENNAKRRPYAHPQHEVMCSYSHDYAETKAENQPHYVVRE